MSKSRGNIVTPDELVAKYGSDALRGYEMFVGPADQDSEWQVSGITGIYRFLEKVWRFFSLQGTKETSIQNKQIIHRLIRKITEGY